MKHHDRLRKFRQELEEGLQNRSVIENTSALSAVAVVFRFLGREPQILFIQRSIRSGDPWSGHMAFPGGRQSEIDRNSHQTAAREAFEEVGISLSEDTSLIGQLNEIRGRKGGSILDFKIVPHVYILEKESELKIDTREVQAAYWIDLSHFLKPDYRTYFYLPRPEGELALPGVSFQSEIIWGLTYSILTDLFSRIERSETVAQIQQELGLSYPPFSDWPKNPL